MTARSHQTTYAGKVKVKAPLGSTSTVLPQNLSLGWMLPWKMKGWSGLVPVAWKAETGGWCDTCSEIQVKPRSGLNAQRPDWPNENPRIEGCCNTTLPVIRTCLHRLCLRADVSILWSPTI